MKDTTLKIAAEVKADEALTILANSAPPLWRLQFIRILQILGTATAVFAGMDLTPYLALLDPKIALILGGAGIFAKMEAPAIINFLGDLFDNGKLDKSFPPVVGMFLIGLLCLGIPACSTSGWNLGVTPDGCLMTGRTDANGRSYKAGACVGPDGKIATYVTEWQNVDGQLIRGVYTLETRRTVFYYRDPEGGWIQWSSKSGIILGPVPQTPTAPAAISTQA